MTWLYNAVVVLSYLVNLTSSVKWQTKAADKKRTTREQIPKDWILDQKFIPTDKDANVLRIFDECGILSPLELELTERYNAKELLAKIHDGTFTSVEVTTAFCKRAAIATQLTDCCTELMFEFAIERAKALDKKFVESGIVGPLHGLPVSLKDSFNVPGFDSTIGYVAFIGNGSEIDEFSALPQSLWDMGAVFHVKTNVPQTLMTTESTNHIWGTVLNPNNISLGAGGSSGGEGALARMRGSIVGIGTDIGGSIRIPSVCNGVYGFKPTSGRTPYGGQTNQNEGDITKIGVTCSAGPLASNYEALEVILEHLLRNKPYQYDPEVNCVDFNNQFSDWFSTGKKLTIGFILEDPRIPVYPNIKRTLLQAADLLTEAGHTVIPLSSHPSIYDGWFTANRLFYYDNTWDTWKNIVVGGEPPLSLLSHFSLPPFSWWELTKWTKKRVDIKSQWRKLFEEKQLDIIMCPGSPSSAAPHNCFGRAPYLTNWNNCDFPACIIPFGEPVNPDDKFEDSRETAMADSSQVLIPTKIPFDPVKFKGGIGHIQIVARNYEDEKLLACGKIVNSILHKSKV